MGDASLKDITRLRHGRLADADATFYVTQRKLPFAPCLGHERLVRLLIDSQIDRPRLRFLEQDRAGLQLFAKARAAPLLQRLYYLKRSGVYRQTWLGNIGLVVATLLKRI